ncbi:endonuclease V [Bacillus subtilis subsp. subtilis]|uniref:Endonuclease V n=3 Tax=Bacillus subtilis subsp. subtilis TaxID=135461 RepID=NFI_BACSU|nr:MULTISPECIES: endonuclease V [Bacillales]NP_391498.2 endonuclease V [Bacillus subtilis subsp. subtilis str. 168]P96724.2 RecName: Full=Endonuclease V; AltName: Full=Deoxyinosine 3'endonuclease; AltName: Full=Deoxyribonuclease V; Short=DNase V [Bacillus subtilis subsp. subtilis str. 168]BAM55696.1 deoxyribonuclease V [Bacillus subtilis BEST7613]AFQ59468.1 Putative deoxyribonuclease V [Bacillus subtilis QB928]AGG63028.1 putative deoxyribonuclease V [Bacillus subtilis subsp. subtilis 6051-HGW]
MKVFDVHKFDMKKEQDFLQVQFNLKNRINLSPTIHPDSINTCAGVDLAYWEQDGEPYGVCCIIVIDADTKEVIEKVHSMGRISVPYVSGFLAFRELPLIIEAAKKLETEPDVFLFDGNGYLHYNHMGVATHAAFFLGKPTIGIAKTYLKIKGCDFVTPEIEVGAYTDIIIDGEVYGRALRTRRDVKPIFLSCGNYIDLDSSYQITMSLINQESRLPIPVRLADLETHVLRTFYQKNHV